MEKNGITDAAYHTETGTLSQNADNDTCSQGNGNCCMFGTGTSVSFSKMNKSRCSHQQNQKCDLDRGEYESLQLLHFVASLQGIASVQEKYTCSDTCSKADNTE